MYTWIFIGVIGVLALGYQVVRRRTAGSPNLWLSFAPEPLLSNGEIKIAQFTTLRNGVTLTDRRVHITRMARQPVYIYYADIASVRGGYIFGDSDLGEDDPMWGLTIRTVAGKLFVVGLSVGASRAADLIEERARRARAGDR